MNITRRSAIRTLSLGAGSSLLAPVFSQLTAQAAGAPARKRFVFVLQSNGINPNHIIPAGRPLRRDKETPENDSPISTSLAGLELPEAIADLAPFRDKLTLIRGLSGRVAEGGTGGHSTNHGALGCYPGSAGPMSQTIDCALGEALPGIVRNVALGILKKPDQTLNYQLCASGPGKALPVQCDPEQAFRGLFSSVLQGQSRAEFDRRTNLLDFMRDDIRRTRDALAGSEREKLEDYLAAFESLHLRQGKIDSIKPALSAAMPKLDTHFAKPHEVNRLEAQFEIGAAALISGLSNVVTLTSGGGGQQYLAWPELGIPVDGHENGHGKGVGAFTSEQCFVKVRQFHCKLIARLAARLASVREGNGTMLDNTLIVYLSDSGEAHHPNLREWPVITLGGFAGITAPNGRYLELPGYGKAKHRTLANLYLTFLQAAGAPREKFGLADNGLRDIDQRGIVPELLV